MSLTRFPAAADTINQVALEVGLPTSPAPFAAQDPVYSQLVGLLNAAGRELAGLYNWQSLQRSITFTTLDTDTGVYDLPDDWGGMIDQTNWSRSDRLPVGALTPQQWAYVTSRSEQPILCEFREAHGQLWLYPQPPPAGKVISLQYASRAWVKPAGWAVGQPYSDKVVDPSDTILFDPYLIERFLKLKFLAAKTLPTTEAQNEFLRAMDAKTGRDASAAVLSLNGPRRALPLLGVGNLPDSGYGR